MIFVDVDGNPYKPNRFLTFDDVLLRPQRSSVKSRKDVDLRNKMSLSLPIISANMDTVTNGNMLRHMGFNGGMGILHRFMSIIEQIAVLEDMTQLNQDRLGVTNTGHLGSGRHGGDFDIKDLPFGFSIGIDPDDYKVRLLRSYGVIKTCMTNNLFVCIDIAHGGLDSVLDVIKFTKDNCPGLKIIAGNVATPETAKALEHEGTDVIKVGVGPGSACTTRIITGHGIPQLSAIMTCREALNPETLIIADGGIRTSGDGVKCLAVGADALMLGRILASTWEAPGRTETIGDESYKRFRGMASRGAQKDWKGPTNNTTPEGEETLVPITGHVHEVVRDFCGGLRSGCSYSGAHNLEELRENAEFIEVSVATVQENKAHAKY